MKNIKKTSIALIAAAMLTFTACSDSSNSGGYTNAKSAQSAYSADMAESPAAEYYTDDTDDDYAGAVLADADTKTFGLNTSGAVSNNAGANNQSVLTSQKMVYTGSVELETLEYDNAASAIRNNVDSYGGFIESSSESNRNKKWYFEDQVYETDRLLSITVRIPSEHFNEFLSGLSSYGQVMNQSTNAENISRQYADNQAEIAALEKEQERLLQMMDAADTIEEMIRVEDRLTTVQSQLNKYKSTLSAMDADVQFSRISITVTEVHKYTEIKQAPEPEPTFLERLSEHIQESAKSFLNVLEALLFVIIALFPYLLIIAVVVIIIVAAKTKHNKKILAQMPPANTSPTKPAPYGSTAADKEDKKDVTEDKKDE
ncbi:MAG: DUF4349 domain-containing protein [Oscillospiraceae bacterium]|nr:DUF4349 domain-containing protein [Oscillospiraceae bacterium]